MLIRALLFAVAASAALPAQPPKLADTKFLQMIASAGKAEVATAQVGVEKASAPEVKSYAQVLVDDHTKLNAIIAELARIKGVPLDLNALPATDDLGLVTGPPFDPIFLRHMIRGHEQMIAELEQEAKASQDLDITGFIQATIPIVRGHLEKAKALLK